MDLKSFGVLMVVGYVGSFKGEKFFGFIDVIINIFKRKMIKRIILFF